MLDSLLPDVTVVGDVLGDLVLDIQSMLQVNLEESENEEMEIIDLESQNNPACNEIEVIEESSDDIEVIDFQEVANNNTNDLSKVPVKQSEILSIKDLVKSWALEKEEQPKRMSI